MNGSGTSIAGMKPAADLPDLEGTVFTLDRSGTRSTTLDPILDIVLVDTEEGIRQAAEILRKESVLGFDTETAFYEDGQGKLAKIQFTAPNAGLTILIDPIRSYDEALETIEYRDLSPLTEILADESITKVGHNVSYDERVFEELGIEVKGTADTMVMAQALLPELPSRSFAACCKILLGVELEKEQQTSNWLPSFDQLSSDQILYMERDSRLVLDLYRVLLPSIRQAQHSVSELDLEAAMQESVETDRRLQQLIIERAPEFHMLQAKREALGARIRELVPEGGDEIETDFGRVYPGQKEQSFDLELLFKELERLCPDNDKWNKLETALNKAITHEASRSGVLTALGKFGPERFALATKRDIDARLEACMFLPEGEQSFNVKPDITKVDTPPYTLDESLGVEELLKELTETHDELIRLQLEVASELPVLRYRLKLLEKQMHSRVETGERYSGRYGVVVPKNRQRKLNVNDAKTEFQSRLIDSEQAADLAQLFDGLVNTNLSREKLKGILKSEDFEFLGLESGHARRDFYERVTREGEGYTQTKIYPAW